MKKFPDFLAQQKTKSKSNLAQFSYVNTSVWKVFCAPWAVTFKEKLGGNA